MLKRGRGITRILSLSGIRLSGPHEGSHGHLIPSNTPGALHPTGPAVSTHPPPSSAGYRAPVTGGPTPPHRHPDGGRAVSVPEPRVLPVPRFGAVGPRGVRSFLTPPATSGEGREPLPRPLPPSIIIIMYDYIHLRQASWEGFGVSWRRNNRG